MDKATFRTPNGLFTVSAEVDGPKGLFEKASAYREVFQDTACGVCGSSNIFPQVRLAGQSDEYTYYEMVCLHLHENGFPCRARLSFGESKDKARGNPIYPKRKNEDGTWSKTRGWEVYKPKDGEVKEPPPPPRATAAMSAPSAAAAPAPAPSLPLAMSASDQHELTELIAKAGEARGANTVFVDLCERLRKIGGNDLANQCWISAIGPDPDRFPRPSADVVADLFHAWRSNRA